MNDRFVCIHGHFYQPPRENAWLEAVEMQDSAFPNHDWNERITDECYGPNARARVLDDHGWIIDMINNYAHLSFNFGPTLLAWLNACAPQVYARIIEADRESMQRFGGHGSAMAQAYNHMIMPLANARDRTTQIRWGIRDFEARFGRKPLGMWLPETGVDTATLEDLAAHDITFTILAPRQAARVRPIDNGEWTDVATIGGIDPSMAYVCRLPSGRSMNLFFYDGPISQAVAFEGLLHSGPHFAMRLMDAFDSKRTHAQLAHIATDGETYGHHHRHGEMALADALRRIITEKSIRLTNYAEFLSLHPPTHEVQIVENSSWSCVHGVGRWMSDCGCHSGLHSGWHQRWRGPLRAALDWLRDSVSPLYEENASAIFADPWSARDAYIDVLLDRSTQSLEQFFAKNAKHEGNGVSAAITPELQVRGLRLLELQRHAMYMYTSCGWFFDDIAGIETMQVIHYAGRVIQLAREIFNQDFEPEFLNRLEQAEGNDSSQPNGKEVYLQCVKPTIVDLPRVAAHYAISSLFEDYPEKSDLFCYEVQREHALTRTVGRSRLVIGRATITSRITTEAQKLSYGVLHIGEHVINCGVRQQQSPAAYDELVKRTGESFARADFAQTLREMDRSFGNSNYSIASLFRDEQHRVVRLILAPTLQHVDSSFAQLYDQHSPLMEFLRVLGLPIPRRMQIPAAFVINQMVQREFAKEEIDLSRIRTLLEDAKTKGVQLDDRNIAFAAEALLDRIIAQLSPETSIAELSKWRAVIAFLSELPLDVNPWQAQEEYFDRRQRFLPTISHRLDQDGTTSRWIAEFAALGEALKIRSQ